MSKRKSASSRNPRPRPYLKAALEKLNKDFGDGWAKAVSDTSALGGSCCFIAMKPRSRNKLIVDFELGVHPSSMQSISKSLSGLDVKYSAWFFTSYVYEKKEVVVPQTSTSTEQPPCAQAPTTNQEPTL